MSDTRRLLVIAPAATAQVVTRALPDVPTVLADKLLRGVWELGQGDFAAALVSLSVGGSVADAVRNMRKLAPATRLFVICRPVDEPVARELCGEGVEDYLLEPLAQGDLDRIARLLAAPQAAAPEAPEPAAAAEPTAVEVLGLSDVLKQLADGPVATLGRMARLVKDAFGASGVTVQLDELSAETGEPEAPAAEEPIWRHGRKVGRVMLGAPRAAAYTLPPAGRLPEYARLVETTAALARERQRWRELAWTDDLTGLRNRRYCEHTLQELIARAMREQSRLTVLFFDIDEFKTYNDRYGHDTGDALLREIGALLLRCSRERDVVCRYGGDEFAVILWDAEAPRVPGSQHPSEPLALAERFRQAIGEHKFGCLERNAPGPVTISGGLARFPWDGATPAQLLRAADAALLRAKRCGKNQIVLVNGVEPVEEVERVEL